MKPVALCTVERIARSVNGNHSIHIAGLSAEHFLRIASIARLNLSTCPFACGL